jgi:rfaE bifunctional protein kinase chain/domain
MDFKGLFDQFLGKRILVIGDVMIDSYLRGKVNRVSPEAPVPIVSLEKEEDRLGGAANVAVNLVALGAAPIICSVVGSDKQGNDLQFLLKNAGISSEGLIYSHTRKTTVKTRVIGNNQQLLRIDSEQTDPVSANEEELLIRKVEELLMDGVDGVIFEDYNKGVLTPKVINDIISLANRHGVVTTVDPKKDNFLAYKKVTLFKPNLKELKEGLAVDFSFLSNKEKFEEAVNQLEKQLENAISFVTLSEYGVFIKKDQDQHYIAAHVRNIADVSGAGDTVISVATLCLVAGAPISIIAEISNIAGGLVCEKSGVVSIDREQLLQETERLLKI